MGPNRFDSCYALRNQSINCACKLGLRIAYYTGMHRRTTIGVLSGSATSGNRNAEVNHAVGESGVLRNAEQIQ